MRAQNLAPTGIEEPRVNVLKLNMGLDRISGGDRPPKITATLREQLVQCGANNAWFAKLCRAAPLSCLAGSGDPARSRGTALHRRSALPLVLVFGMGMAYGIEDGAWPAYGRDPGGTRYSPLKQINSGNVSKLKVAWTYHTHALDPATGAEKWKYDPDVDRRSSYSEVTSRGVSAWTDPNAPPGAICRARIFLGTLDARLIALDARTGRPCEDFGAHGQIDLTRGIDLRDRGDYQVTSPPAVVAGLVITGSSIGDNRAVDVERGVVRGFDVRTGKLRWTWDPIPWAGKRQPRTGAANAWSVFSVDEARGLVIIPTGSASPDFYGGERPGDNAHANSVVALRAATGELVWSFQVVHHDLWDYDVASQPGARPVVRQYKPCAVRSAAHPAGEGGRGSARGGE